MRLGKRQPGTGRPMALPGPVAKGSSRVGCFLSIFIRPARSRRQFPQIRKGPRLHDFRHRFAVEVLTRWYQSAEDAWRLLPVLSTYLGHVYVGDTYWYLSGSPELMALAMIRLERRWGGTS